MNHLSEYLLRDKAWLYKDIFWRNIAARCCVTYFFMFEGILMGVLTCYYADIQDNLGLSDAELGTAALFIYLGSVLASPFAAFFLTQLGSKMSTFLGGLLYGASLSFIPLSKQLGVLILTMFIFGWSMGVMDISMNSSAILTEIIASKPLFGSFHGSYSVAAAAGSLIGGALVDSSYGMTVVFAAFSTVSALTTVFFSANNYNLAQELKISNYKNNHGIRDSISEYAPRTISTEADVPAGGGGVASGGGGPSMTPHKDPPALLAHSSSKKFYPNRSASPTSNLSLAGNASNSMVYTPLMDNHEGSEQSSDLNSSIISSVMDENDSRTGGRNNYSAAKWEIAFYCMIGFLGAFGESSISTWATVYLDRHIQGSSVVHSLGYTCFMISMGLGRFSCDYLRRVVGRRLIMRTGGLLALSGLTLAAFSINLPCSIAFACIGFSITGFGLSTLIPTSFSSAGHIPGVHPGTAISIVSMFTNAGGIVSSPMVGLVSDASSLQWALLCDALLLGLVCPLSWGIPEETKEFMLGRRESAEGHHRGDGGDDDNGESGKLIKNVVA